MQDEGNSEATPLRKGVVRGSVWTGLHVAISLPIAFVVNVVVARILGVVDYGKLGLLTMVITLASAVVSMGVGSALMQFGAKAYASGDTRELSKIVSGVQGYSLLIASPLVSLVVLLVVTLDPWILVLAVAFGVFLPALLQVGPAGLALMQRSDLAAQFAIITNLVLQGAVVVAALTAKTAESIWVVRLIATGVMAALPFLAVPRALRWAALRPKAPWTLSRVFWRFALLTGLAGVVGMLATDRVQIIFLEWWSDPRALGWFALAFGLAAHVLAPVQAMVGPMLPAFAALVERGRDPAREGLVRTSHIAATVAGMVVSFGAPMLAGLVPVLYGDEFTPAASYLVILAASSSFAIASSPSYASVMARLQAGSFLWVNVASAGAMVVVAIVTIPALGGWGAVASAVSGSLFRALCLMTLEIRHFAVPFRVTFRMVSPALWGAGAAVISWLALDYVGLSSDVAQALISGVGGAVVYLVILRGTRTGISVRDARAVTESLPGAMRVVGARFLQVVVTAPRR